MNLVIDLAHCGVSMFQWLEHLGAKSQGLRFNSTWGLKSFSLSHARDEMKRPSFSIECLSWKLNWPIWLVRYQDDYFFPIWRYFAYAWTYYYLASAGLSYNVVKNMYKWVLEFGRVVLQIHFFVISLTNAAKKKKEMKKLPISNPLPKKRFEADLKYNSWRSLFLKTPLIELWLVWRD